MFPGEAAASTPLSNHRGPLLATVAGRIVVPDAGRYTFAIGSEDAFALRIGGHPWKAVHGVAYIDPLDPKVLTQPNGNSSPAARGVIDLPAGEHLLEVLWLRQQSGAELQISSARGQFENEGHTDRWRLLGHQAKGNVTWPGVDEAGWTVTCSKSKGHAAPQAKLLTLKDGLLILSLGKNHLRANGVDAVNYAEHGSERFTRFPHAVPFPNDVKNNGEDLFATRAQAKLVVPLDGIYWIGLHADNLGALRIKGQAWKRLVQSGPPRNQVSLQGDTISFDHAWTHLDPRVVGEIELEKGVYEIEALHVDGTGGASFAVFGSPAGFPPRLLTKNGAAIVADHDGLQLAAQK